MSEGTDGKTRTARSKALSDAVPSLVARGELHVQDLEQRQKSGEPAPSPQDTQKRHDLLFLRGAGELRVAKAALDHAGLRPDVYDGLARTLADAEATDTQVEDGDVGVVHNYVVGGMEGIEGRRDVVDSLQVVRADVQVDEAERSAATGLLTTLGVELQQN